MPAAQAIHVPGVGALAPADVLARAMQAHERGDLDTADSLASRILSRFPNQAESLYLRGIIAHQRGKPASAEKYLRRAIKAAPKSPMGHGGLGIVRLGQGRLQDAVVLFEQALSISPGQPHIHNNFGLALSGLGKFAEAALHYDEALRMVPNYADAWLNLGKLRQDEGRLPDASRCYVRALKIAPNMAEAHNNLGNLHHRTGQVNDALAAYARAVEENPGYAEALFNKAVVQAEIGQISDAINSYRAVIEAEPDHVEAMCGLGEALETVGQEAEAIECYHSAARMRPRHLHEEREERLHYTLGRTFDRLKDYDRAFAEIKIANELRLEALRRSGQIYNRSAQEQLVDGIIAAFPVESAKHWTALGLADNTPIFVLGMPRSGTTLAEQILASHPQVHGAGELMEFPRIGQRLTGDGNWWEEVDRLDSSLAATLANDYLAALRKKAPTAQRIVDKLPTNFLLIGLIRAIFPNATIVHMRRDRRDNCISNYFQNFSDAVPHIHDLADFAHYYHQYDRLMEHWNAVFPAEIFHLDYEWIVREQEAASRALIDWCGLDWDDRCLDFHKTNRTVQTTSYLQVRRPIYDESIGRWRHYEQHLGQLFHALDADYVEVVSVARGSIE
jgi:tetratricopeptide (TPR) repeat protein